MPITLRSLLLPAIGAALACGPRADQRQLDTPSAAAEHAPADRGHAERAAGDPRCPGVQNGFECARVVEGVALARDTLVRRAGDSLVLALRGGGVRVFVDSGEVDSGQSERFSYDSHLADLGLYVVHRQYYEGQEYELVSDRTGRGVLAPEVPVLSPDRRRLTSAVEDLVTGEMRNRLVIWRLDGDSLVEELALQPESWGPSDPVWADDSTLRVTHNVFDSQTGRYRKLPLAVRLRGGRWEVDSAAVAAPAR